MRSGNNAPSSAGRSPGCRESGCVVVVGEQGAACRQPPRGLPRDDPEAELHELRRGASKAAPGRRVVGLRQVNGMPHEPVVVGNGPVGERCELVGRPPVRGLLSDNRSAGPRTSPDSNGRLTFGGMVADPPRRSSGRAWGSMGQSLNVFSSCQLCALDASRESVTRWTVSCSVVQGLRYQGGNLALHRELFERAFVQLRTRRSTKLHGGEGPGAPSIPNLQLAI